MKQWGHTWEGPFILALLADIADNANEAERVLAVYDAFYKYIFEKSLSHLYNLKPLLDVRRNINVVIIFLGSTSPKDF